LRYCFCPNAALLLKPLTDYQTEREAQQYCPNDTVVWLNGRTAVYHFKGQRWYGATKEGCYEYRKEADRQSDRPN